MSKSPARRDATPIFGVPTSRAVTPVQGVPIPGLERDPAAPVAPIEVERTGRPYPAPSRMQPPAAPVRDPRTRHATTVPAIGAGPAPPTPTMTQPVVTFHKPEPPAGLNPDDLFRDIGEPPRTSHASVPVRLDEPAAVKAAADLLDLGRYEEAMAAYDDQLRTNPTDRSARAGRELAFGLKLAAAGDRVGAAQHLEAA